MYNLTETIWKRCLFSWYFGELREITLCWTVYMHAMHKQLWEPLFSSVLLRLYVYSAPVWRSSCKFSLLFGPYRLFWAKLIFQFFLSSVWISLNFQVLATQVCNYKTQHNKIYHGSLFTVNIPHIFLLYTHFCMYNLAETIWKRCFFVEIVVTRSNQAQKPTVNRQKQRKVTCVILRRHVGVLYTHIACSIHRFVHEKRWFGLETEA